jgi:hypothetical protein
MRSCLLLFCSLICAIYSYSQVPVKEFAAVRTEKIPVIDGVLDDEVWKTANSVTEMIQREPIEGINASQKVDIRLLYDNNAIYVYAQLFDRAPDSIRHDLGSRDDQNIIADRFYVGFDTYKRLDAYVFGVTASGVQMDYKDSDPTYDAVWQSAVKINDQGWAVEMKIPYSAIRFPSTTTQEWGFQLIRITTRTQEYDQWALTPKTISNSRLLWGKLKGLSNITAPVRLSLNPFLTAYVENSPTYNPDGSTTYTNSFSYNAGADLKYGIDEKYTLDLTLLPDFNQVQSDNKVKNLSYQEITYNENRPFFKEGTELFNKDNMFYSRRIGKTPGGYYTINSELNENEFIKENPSKTKLLNAIKISGRGNTGLGVGFFNAITDNTYAIIEDQEGNTRKVLTEPLTNYNILVFDQQYKNEGSFHFINTNVIRTKKYDNANVSGTGFTLPFLKNKYAFDGTAFLSQKFRQVDTLENTFNDLMGYNYFIGGRKISGNYQYGYSHSFINKTFDSRDLGYQVIGNKKKERLYILYNLYKPTRVYKEMYNSLIFDYMTNPETQKVVYNQVMLDVYSILPNYWGIELTGTYVPLKYYSYDEPRVPGRFSEGYRYYFTSFMVNTDVRKALSLSLYTNYGNFTEKFNGWELIIIPGIRYQINDKMLVNYNYTYDDDTYNIGFADIDENGNIIYGGREIKTLVNNLNLQYIFKNDMTLNLFARHYWKTGEYKQYYTLEEDGSITPNNDYTRINDFSYNAFNIDLIYSWQFAPGSNLSIVYKNAIETDENEIESRFFSNLSGTINGPQTNSLSVKILYYLDYNTVRGKFNKT